MWVRTSGLPCILSLFFFTYHIIYLYRLMHRFSSRCISRTIPSREAFLFAVCPANTNQASSAAVSICMYEMPVCLCWQNLFIFRTCLRSTSGSICAVLSRLGPGDLSRLYRRGSLCTDHCCRRLATRLVLCFLTNHCRSQTSQFSSSTPQLQPATSGGAPTKRSLTCFA